jgi:hypothetical protein
MQVTAENHLEGDDPGNREHLRADRDDRDPEEQARAGRQDEQPSRHDDCRPSKPVGELAAHPGSAVDKGEARAEQRRRQCQAEIPELHELKQQPHCQEVADQARRDPGHAGTCRHRLP